MDTNDPLAHVLNARPVYHLPGEDPDERSREIIRQTLDFFQAHLMRG